VGRRADHRWEAWARGSGWRYQPSRRDLPDRFTGPPFDQDTSLAYGYRTNARHVLTGQRRGRSATVFEYGHLGDPGWLTRWQMEYQRIAVVPLPAVRPYLEVRPAGGTPPAGPPVAHRFAAMFQVRSAHLAFARDVLGPPLTGWLVSRPGPAVPFRFE
jgi:hypothetical protein